MTDGSDPFSELEQLFDEFVQFGFPMMRDPPVDVVDADEEIVVLVDLPGRDHDSITVTLEENRRLDVAAGSRDERMQGRYVKHERDEDAVSRSVRLPAAVDEEATEAEYDRGVLTITLPKLTGDGTDIPVN